MKPLVTLFFIIIAGSAIAQNNFRPINRDSVKLAVTDTTKETYYPKLLQRFNQLDTTLTLDDYRLIYYGFVFQDNYKAMFNDKEGEISMLAGRKKYDKALEECNSVLEQMPVGLKPNFYKGLLLYQMAENDSAKRFANRYKMLLNAVLSSGDGLTCETGFRAICISDEYNILRNYLRKSNPLHITAYPCDKFKISKSDLFNARTIYFDISESFRYLEEKFKKKE